MEVAVSAMLDAVLRQCIIVWNGKDGESEEKVTNERKLTVDGKTDVETTHPPAFLAGRLAGNGWKKWIVQLSI